MDRTRVLIVQQIVPHYRVPLFKQLAASTVAQYTVAFGKEHKGSSLESLVEEPGFAKRLLGNHFLGRPPVLTYQGGLLSTVLRKEYEVVIAEFNLRILSNIAACIAAKLRGVRFVWWGHGIGPSKNALSRRLRMLFVRLADAIIFYDQMNANLFVRWGTPKEKVFVAWNSIDTSAIDEVARSWDGKRRNRIICIGRLIPQKKVDLLVRAFAELKPGAPDDSLLTVVGDGPEAGRLHLLAQELGIKAHVEFTGELTKQDQLAAYFNSSFVSVSPGYVGLSVIHSLAFGVPVVAADAEPHSPEVAALEDGKNARYFRANDPHALAQLLRDLLHDPVTLAGMSKAARETIQGRFSIEAMAGSFDKAVAKVTTGGQE
jgi:glycosyltransferase involved in cell wall biosynthesis